MGLLHLVVAALAATAVLAADPPCACVNPDQTIDPIKNPMIFYQQPTFGGQPNGKTCSMNCNFVARLDANADDDACLQVQILTNTLTGSGKIIINGLNDTVAIFPGTPATLLYPKSYDVSITLDFTEGATDNGEFMLVVKKTTGRPAKPNDAPTTSAPITPDYDHKFIKNPRLVANDIMLVFDLSSKDIESYKTFARDMIKELAVIPKSLDGDVKEDCGAGSRLSLVGLSALSGFNNLYAPYWTTSYDQADGNINSLVRIANGDSRYLLKPLQDNYLYGFDQKSTAAEEIYTKCANRGRILVLFTSTAPFEYNKDQPDRPTLEINFVDQGVHQILVQYGMNATEQKYYDVYDNTAAHPDSTNIWNIFPLNGGDKDIETFFNQYLVETKEPMTCQKTAKDSAIVIGEDSFGPSGTPKTVDISIPPYYDARSTSGGTWKDTKKHYCNFQSTTVKITRNTTVATPIPLCMKVYYDLETGRDFVSIFSGNPSSPSSQEEIVRLTGRDVSGTYFDLDDASGSIVFSSDEKSVYDGFHAEISKGPCTV